MLAMIPDKQITKYIGRHAIYKGIRIAIDTASDTYYNVLVDCGRQLNNDFLLDQKYNGHTEYHGKIRRDDPDLELLDQI
jgi:hypothetical protein